VREDVAALRRTFAFTTRAETRALQNSVEEERARIEGEPTLGDGTVMETGAVAPLVGY